MTSRRIFLDTADWRAHDAGLAVEFERDGTDGPVLSMRDNASATVLASARVDRPPPFARDLPASPKWEPLRSAIEDRRLFTQVELRTRAQRLRILNGDGKTTATVLLERHVVGEDGAPHRLLGTATVLPVRGYTATADRVATALEDAGLVEETEPLTVAARTLLAAAPPGRPPGPAVDLEPTMPATSAVLSVLERLREQVVANEQGVRQRLDREFLHECRVAIRRARSILKQARGFLAPETATWLSSELRWLGGLTGPARDLDVYIVHLDERPDPDLAPLRRYLVECRSLAQHDLVAAMDSPRYRDLLATWESIAAPADPVTTAGDAADQLIVRAHRRVLRRGAAIDPSSPASALHDLRKRAKELRYLLECFASLYPESARGAAVKELKALQDNLGEFQDCQVQAAALRIVADDLMSTNSVPASTLMAMGRLGVALVEREDRAREEFDERFRRFSSAKSRGRFASLVANGAAGTP